MTRRPTPARTVLRHADMAAAAAGFDVRRMGRAAAQTVAFVRSFRAYRRAAVAAGRPAPALADVLPMLGDTGDTAGATAGHYFRQDLWVARQVFRAGPARHVDVGSRVDGLVAHLLVFADVEVVDVRPLPSTVAGLRFVQADGRTLDALEDRSVPSLSSLHAVEHFGLGRYGDPLDPAGSEAAMRALARVLAPGGRLYFSVPTGRPRVEFNAHRVFAPSEVTDAFAARGLVLDRFAAIDDADEFHEDVTPSILEGADYGCGIYVFRRPGG